MAHMNPAKISDPTGAELWGECAVACERGHRAIREFLAAYAAPLPGPKQ